MTNATLRLHQSPSPTSLRGEPIVHTRTESGVLILRHAGECLGGDDARRLAEVCLGYAEPEGGGWTRQALSLGMTRVVTCGGLRALLHIADSLASAGGRLVLFGVAPHDRAIIRRTGLSRRLHLARDSCDALARARDTSHPHPARYATSPQAA